MNTDGNGSLRYRSCSSRNLLVQGSCCSTAHLLSSPPRTWLVCCRPLCMRMQSRKGVSRAPGAIRSHPCSSVATLSFTRAALEIGQAVQRLEGRQGVHVEQVELLDHRVGLLRLAEEGKLAGIAW